MTPFFGEKSLTERHLVLSRCPSTPSLPKLSATRGLLTLSGETDELNIFDGVVQGDTVAPYVFVIVLYCSRSAVNGREKQLGFTVNSNIAAELAL